MEKEIKSTLTELGFKSNEVKVYLALTKLGESPASRVAKKADLPRTTVISILEKLASDGMLSTHKYKGAFYYWIESPKTLQQLFENKIKIAVGLGDLLSNLYHTEANFPHADIYDSKKSVRNFIERTLIDIPKKSIILTIDSAGSGNYEKIFSNDVGKTLIDLKNKKQLTTKTLVPNGQLKKINQEKITNQNIIIRELPAGLDFQASLWIIEDRLVLFSGTPPFIVSISNKIITESLKNVFNYLWNISTQKN
jgi:sugar-specific transcriptional regulator TrmB